MLRPYLLQILRFLGLSHLLDRGRYMYSKFKNRSINAQFKTKQPDFLLPPDYLIYESFHLNYEAYYRTGLEAANWIKDHFAAYDQSLTGKTIIDWGCGPGRVLRHLPHVFGHEGNYVGMDPNIRSIDWCQQNLKGVSAQLSQLRPPLSLADQQVDLLYGISIFTHLSGPAHDDWFTEIMRVLKPGGMALFTTHGPAYKVKLTKTEQTLFDQNKWVIRGGVTEGHRVYTAYHPPKRFRQLVNDHGAEVLNYVAGKAVSWGHEQDTWVIKKLS